MWIRLTFNDLRTIAHYLGVLVLFSTLTYVPPMLVGIVFGEWDAVARYLFAAGVSLVSGSLLRFARVEHARLNQQQALIVTGLVWVVLAFFASIPLYGSGHFASYLDAFFDSVSGLTTTGASIILDLDHLSYTDNMFRFMIHLFGGLGVIVVAISFGLFGKNGGSSMYNSEGRSEHVVPNIVQTARFIGKLAMVFILAATALLTIMLVFNGMFPTRAFLHALWLSISGFITGGFTPTSLSVMYYHNLGVEIVLMVLMVLGTINFMLYNEIIHGRLRPFLKDLETRTLVIWLTVVALVFAASLVSSAMFNGLPAMLRRGLFLIVGAFTTTGFQNVTTNEFTTVLTSGAFLVLALLMAVGGSAGSTAGGIKLFRVGVIAKSMFASVKKKLSPDSARVVVSYEHIGRRVLTPGVVSEAMTVCLLFVATYLLGSMAGIAHGYEATQAVFESVAMASNGGLTSGIVSAGMPPSLEIVYIFEMWAGRLEFLTLLALIAKIVVSLDPRKWGEGRRRNG